MNNKEGSNFMSAMADAAVNDMIDNKLYNKNYGRMSLIYKVPATKKELDWFLKSYVQDYFEILIEPELELKEPSGTPIIFEIDKALTYLRPSNVERVKNVCGNYPSKILEEICDKMPDLEKIEPGVYKIREDHIEYMRNLLKDALEDVNEH